MIKSNLAWVILRKLIATFVTVTLSSFVLSVYLLVESTSKFNLGNHLLQSSLFYGIYIGMIVLVYGNIVSIALEYVQKKWFEFHNWVYVLFHGLFGLANGLLFPIVEFALAGMTAALLYAITDRWLAIRITERKSLKHFIIVPILLYVFSWGLLQLISPSMPYFTKEDAVEFATASEGTIIDLFPKEIGEKVERINGYKVIRETKVAEMKQEVYIVTFIESWSNEDDSGNWYISYKVKRGQLSAYNQGGNAPSYH